MTNTNTSNDHSSYYILNREYFSECFDESANTVISLKTFRQAIILFIAAGVFFVIEIGSYLVWFLLCLGCVELLSIRYKRSWWITRQMFSRAAGSKVNIRIDDQGLFTDSAHHKQAILWQDITDIRSTEKGFVVVHNSGTNYLSRSGLDEDILAMVSAKVL